MHLVRSFLLFMAFAGTAYPATIFYVFNTGEGILSPIWPSTGSTSPNGSTGGVSLGTNVLSLVDPNSGTLEAATLTGSGTLFCAVASVATQCADDATSEASTNAAHASGLAVGNGRMNEGETLTIQINPGFVGRLISFQITAMIGPGAAQESGVYNLGSGNVTFLGGSNAIDTYTVNSGPFTTLVFSVPTGGPNGGHTWTLHSLELDITAEDSPAGIPEPGTWSMLGAGLAAIGIVARRRR